MSLFSYFTGGASIYGRSRIKNTEKEETIKAIKNSFKKSIEITTKKILNEYKENNTNYDLIEGNELITLINEITEKIIQPEEETFSIIDLFENFIYGLTPLYKSCKKALEIFISQNGKKILFIISDGLLNDVDIKFAQDDIMSKTNELGVTTIYIYFNSSNKMNEKKFYNKIQSNFDEGVKFLFNISSELNYHNGIIQFFIKKNWNIPLNGVCKLFVEINNSEDLNQFINLVNETLNYNEPIEHINNWKYSFR